MAELTLKPKEADVLKLSIGEESFYIPLATSLTFEEAEELKTRDGIVGFLRKYIRAEVADALTIGNWTEIMTTWTEASREAAGGLSLGE